MAGLIYILEGGEKATWLWHLVRERMVEIYTANAWKKLEWHLHYQDNASFFLMHLPFGEH